MELKREYRTYLSTLIKSAYRFAYLAWQFYLRCIGRYTEGAQLIVSFQGKILLVKSCYRPCYSFPGGYRNVDESASKNALRELKEETGLILSEHQLTLVEFHQYSIGKSSCIDHLYRAEIEEDALDQLKLRNVEIEIIGLYNLQDIHQLPKDYLVSYYLNQYGFSHFSKAENAL